MSRSGPMQRILFSSAELPADLDDRARFSFWRDLYAARYGVLDIQRSHDKPFAAQFEFAPFAGLGIGHFKGTISRVGRTRREVAQTPSDNLCLVVNCGHSTMSFTHRGREAPLAPGAATLFDDSEPGALHGASDNAWFALVVPRKDLLALVAKAEDLSGRPFSESLPALRHLRRYLDALLPSDGVGGDTALQSHIGTALLDLVALVLGATREGPEMARMRGLRAARLQDINVEIETSFAHPGFTVHTLASTLRLSPRYVQDLLDEAGDSFTGRVLERRLQRARAMLSDRRHDRSKISDITFECGFASISYFNRCFRRRFGVSPSGYRRACGADRG